MQNLQPIVAWCGHQAGPHILCTGTGALAPVLLRSTLGLVVCAWCTGPTPAWWVPASRDEISRSGSSLSAGNSVENICNYWAVSVSTSSLVSALAMLSVVLSLSDYSD